MTEPPVGQERPPETFDQLMAQQAVTTRDIAAADKTNWDGRYEAVRERGLRGRAQWTGKLQYDNKRVLDRLKENVRPSRPASRQGHAHRLPDRAKNSAP